MRPTGRLALTRSQLDNVAWQFLRSEFTDEVYARWPIDRRLDAFLLHRGYRRLHDDGSAYGALLDRVMANMAAAARNGAQFAPRDG
ncbi:hypothetical protein [Mycolicibacterium diernhoferi]|uniref:Uncharacterized protein n=1 Tax=Mycolicibacterium diernhoferi TaxID=1801 RepID=A0A1Q4HF48_9MYCO|nr:hypothetical protein [Mycolicibacterium diernhoferi]OJZ66021.1 hypothetical protein BRW64_11485 [Mycolicibacterium diernhoferi]OPE55012.1 hypothetical protein BV510_07195 [Mycolicibacterium diernhoferi]PEG54618.1 hypothetical protein CRI78_10555 [Mycolicibacterium diernhoferi]QYL23926.1 hypothetical protein K0O62_06430 [Mycolicibacterium diernhoferi]